MGRFSQITVVGIDGRVRDLTNTINSLVYSSHQLPGSRALLLSPEKPMNLPDGIEHQKISNLGYWEYSIFVMHFLCQYIKTEFALIVQEDGWVIDGSNWSDEFFSYDFVGAPTHFARVTKNFKQFFGRNYSWTPYLDDRDARVQVVMNGGFSIRSQRLMSAPSKLALPFKVSSIHLDQSSGTPNMIGSNEDHLEDVQLCINMKNDLEDFGVKFAPIKLARGFSVEHLNPVIHHDLNLSGVLGHHSKIRSLVSLNPLTIRYKLPFNTVSQILGEMTLIKLFESKGFKIIFSE